MTQDAPTINAESELVARLRARAQMFIEDFDGAEDNCGNPVCCEELAALDTEAATTIERLHSAHETLFDAIKHGDEVHRAWLREAIDNHFSGKPVPPPRAANPSAHEQGRREGIEMAAGLCDQDAMDYSQAGRSAGGDYAVGARTACANLAIAIRTLSSAPPGEKGETSKCDACDGTGEGFGRNAPCLSCFGSGEISTCKESLQVAEPEKGERIPSGERKPVRIDVTKEWLAKVDELQPGIDGMFQVAAIHGATWPAHANWVKERDALRAALAKEGTP